MSLAPETEPLYTIGVVAEMVALHPQTLRRYELLGLLAPARKAGRRRYSDRDVELLRAISRLSTELGLNMAGVEVILRLNERIRDLQAEVNLLQDVRANLEAQVAALQTQLRRPLD